MSNLSDFLDTIWKDTDGYVVVSVKTKDLTLKRVSPKWPEQRELVLDFILSQTARQNEVYISPALWKKKIGNGVQFNRELLLGSHVLWVDMDGNAPDGWPITPPTDSVPPTGAPGAALDVPEPSIRVQTSSPSNQHMYWLLDEMITDPDTLENMTRSLYLKLNADSGFDATRILRPPDTTNYGYGKDERKGKTYPVFLETTSDRVYNQSAFPVVKDFRPLVDDKLGDIPPIEEVFAKCKWSDYFWEAFNAEPQYKKRSDQLQELAYLGAEAGFTDEQIYAVLTAADERWKKYLGRTDKHKRLVDIIDRARAKHPVALSELTFAGLIQEEVTDNSIQTLYNYTDFMNTEIRLEWMLEGLMPIKGYGIIAGPTGVGKSQMGLRIAEKVIIGERFLWWQLRPKDKPFKTLFFSFEMSHPELQQFFKVMSSESFLPRGKDRFFVVPVGETVPLDQPDGQKFFEKKIEEVQPDLVIIDSLSKSMSGDFKIDSDVLNYNRYINRIREKYDTGVIVIHHNRKVQDKKYMSIELDDLYGSRFLTQDASFVLMMGQTKDNRLILNPAKVRFAVNPGPQEIARTPGLDFYVERQIDDNGPDSGPGNSDGSVTLFGVQP